MKKIRDLEAKDFPGVNIEKFHEWKNALIKHRKISDFISYPVFFLFIITAISKNLIVAILLFIGFISSAAYLIPAIIKVNKLRKELGITSKDLRKALKNKYVSNLKEDQGGNEFETDSMQEKKKDAKYEENLKEKKIRGDFRAVPQKDTEVNDSFFNVIMSILISAFIGCASYALLNEPWIIDSIQESEIIKNVILVVLFVSSFIFFMVISVIKKNQKKSIKPAHNKGS